MACEYSIFTVLGSEPTPTSGATGEAEVTEPVDITNQEEQKPQTAEGIS